MTGFPLPPPLPFPRPKKMRVMAAWRAIGVAVFVASPTASCLEQAVDLRSPLPQPEPPVVVCEAGARVNPASGACEPCTRMQPEAEAVCPCAIGWLAKDFPVCDDERAAYECLPCTGGLAWCRTFDASRGVTTSCSLLADCCAELLLAPGALPCCASGSQVDCAPSANLGEYAVSCVGESCCAGAPCPQGQSDCALWQTCDPGSGRCTPACQPQVEYCCEECGCACQKAGPAN